MTRINSVFLLALVVAAGTAEGQTAGSVEIAGFGVHHNKTVPFNARFGVGAGVRVGVWLPASFSLEAQADVTRSNHFAPGTSFTMAFLGGGLLWHAPVAGSARPYLRVGVGVLDSQEPCAGETLRSCGSFRTGGGAVGVRIPLSPAVQLRAEGMYRVRPALDYRSVGLSLGLSWVTGGATGNRPPGVDSDGDGVPDRRDRCPGSPVGALVDSRGCTTDFDGDGVIDGIDRCPRSPRGQPVDPFGCPVTGGSRRQ